jgi:hypothetical protein
MSVISYGGIILHDVLLEHVDQEIEWDHHVGVDPLYLKTTVSVEATFRASVQENDLCKHGAFAGVNLTDMDFVLRRLMEPRQEFIFWLDRGLANEFMHVVPLVIPPGDEGYVAPVFNVPPNPFQPDDDFYSTEVDLNNGPKPKAKLKHIFGQGSAKISFEVELAMSACPGGIKPQVVSLQYNVADDIDELWYTTRSFEGRVRVRDKNLHPHNFRGWALPPIQRGFRRTDQKFVQSQDGLELAFTFKDKEEYASPPFPALKWEGSVTTNATKMGNKWEQVISLTLEGGKNVPKKDLAQVGFAIIDRKLSLIQRFEEEKLVIQWSSITESFHNNRVDFRMSVWQNPEQVEATPISFAVKDFGKFLDEFDLYVGVPEGIIPPGQSSQESQAEYDRNRYQMPQPSAGLANVFNQALHLFCASPLPFPKTPTGMKKPPLPVPIEDDCIVRIARVELPPYEVKTSQEHNKNIYIEYDAAQETRDKTGQYRTPIAKSVGVQAAEITSKIITLFLPQSTRLIKIIGERVGRPPELPEPISFVDPVTQIEHTLASCKLEEEPPRVALNGCSQIFRTRCMLTYHLSRAPNEGEVRRGMSLPYDSYRLVEDNSLDPYLAGTFISPTDERAIS